MFESLGLVRQLGEAHESIFEEVVAAELVFGSEDGGEGPDVYAIDLDGTTAFVAITRIE